MKNGSIADQIKMQERQISDERKMNECSQIGINTDMRAGLSENLFENKQKNNLLNNNDSKQSSYTTDLRLSSVLGILTPEPSSSNEEQSIKPPKKKKKRKRISL